MEIRFNEKRPIEQIELDDGSKVSRIPIARRHHHVCLAVGIVMLPFFVAAPLLVESFSTLFTVCWCVAVGLFFCIWFWANLSYLKDPDRFGLQVDADGIRERLLLQKMFWRWTDIASIQLVGVDSSMVVGLNLKQKTWKRKLRIANFDAILSNQYAVSNVEIINHLQEWKQKSQHAG